VTYQYQQHLTSTQIRTQRKRNKMQIETAPVLRLKLVKALCCSGVSQITESNQKGITEEFSSLPKSKDSCSGINMLF
jgi:hypothetical protein